MLCSDVLSESDTEGDGERGIGSTRYRVLKMTITLLYVKPKKSGGFCWNSMDGHTMLASWLQKYHLTRDQNLIRIEA